MGINRRDFLIYAGIGTYELLRTPPLRGATPQNKGVLRKKPAFFEPIEPSTRDDLILPKGYRYDLLCQWGDPIGSIGPHGPEHFGFDNDFLCFFPLDALSEGKNSEEGLLWANHEFVKPLFVSGYPGNREKTKEEILKERLAVGGSVVHLKRGKGKWQPVLKSPYNRRYTSLYPEIPFSGPVSEVLPTAYGTMANCSGGKTPWQTVLSCEENFQWFVSPTGGVLQWRVFDNHRLNEQEYGWVVEIDPFGTLPPRKLSSLGRFCHENAACRISPEGRLVVYLGDDDTDQYFYKYVSQEKYDPKASRERNKTLLEKGTLYTADFITGKWISLDIGQNPDLKKAGFKSQAEVLINTRLAAKAVGATPLDRPEDCEVHPTDGSVYLSLSNNKKEGNFHGRIVRLVEAGDNPEGVNFRYEIFVAGGRETGLSCPDNLTFDRHGNLWVTCDISGDALGKDPYEKFGNNGLFVVPTKGPAQGSAFQFASAPNEAELTGPWFTEKGDTLFLSVQHPGERTKDLKSLTSHWPQGGKALPKPCVVAISGFPR